MQKIQAHDEDNGSAGSDLSQLENDTDTLGRAILQHERDAKRLKKLLNGTRYADRITARYEKLQPDDNIRERSNEIKSRRIPEPAFNVPAEWMPRTRRERSWIRQSRVPVGSEIPLQIDVRTQSTIDRDAIVPHRTSFTGDEYWKREDGHIGDDTPPSMKRRRQHSQTSFPHINSRLRDIVQAEQDEVTDVNVQTSIPIAKDCVSNDLLRRLTATTITNTAELRDNKENILKSDGQRSKHGHLEEVRAQRAVRRGYPRATALRTSAPVIAHRSNLEPFQAHKLNITDCLSTPKPIGSWIDTPKAQQTHKNISDDVKASNEAADSLNSHNLDINRTQDKARSALAEIVPDNGDDVVQALRQKKDEGLEEFAKDHETPITDTANANFQEDDLRVSIDTQKSVPAESVNQLNKHIEAVITANNKNPRPTKRTSEGKRVVDVRPSTYKQKLHRNGRYVCEYCGSTSTGIWRGLWEEFRSNFWHQDSSAFLGIRLTVIGMTVLAWLIWYMVESYMCSRYCQPRYATHMIGTGVIPNAPRFPFVIPALLFRPFAFAWRPLTRWMDWFADLIFEWMFGEITNHHDWPHIIEQSRKARDGSLGVRYAYNTVRQPARWLQTAVAVTTASSKRTVESAIDAIDEFGRVWD